MRECLLQYLPIGSKYPQLFSQLSEDLLYIFFFPGIERRTSYGIALIILFELQSCGRASRIVNFDGG